MPKVLPLEKDLSARRAVQRADEIEQTVGMTIDRALEDVPDLRKIYDSDKQVRELIDTAKKLEGLVRGAGVHASAVVIAPQPLIDLVPLNRTKNDEIVTAYDMKAVEKYGPAQDCSPPGDIFRDTKKFHLCFLVK